jgi:cytochrome c-type biogenesis protein
MSQSPTIIAAFVAGMFSFLSPCVLPLVPGYLGLITGVRPEDAPSKVARARAIGTTGSFVTGFTIVFCLLGAGASTIGGWLLQHQQTLQRVAGVLIIGFGLMIAGVARLAPLQRERRFHVDPRRFGPAGPGLMGMAFAFGWTPCIGPVLGPILTLAATQATVWSGVALLFFYSLGLGVPFLASALLLDKLASTFAWIKRHYRAINSVAGAIMVAFGLVMLTGNLGNVSSWFTDLLTTIGLKRFTEI